jgi:hypothetical protein
MATVNVWQVLDIRSGQVRFIISRAAHEVIIDSQQSSPLCTGAMESGRSLRDSFARDTPAQLWLLPEPEF